MQDSSSPRALGACSGRGGEASCVCVRISWTAHPVMPHTNKHCLR